MEIEEIGQKDVETAMHKMKKGNATGAYEVRLEYGDGWRGGSHTDRKATERVYAGGGYRWSGGWA